MADYLKGSLGQAAVDGPGYRKVLGMRTLTQQGLKQTISKEKLQSHFCKLTEQLRNKRRKGNSRGRVTEKLKKMKENCSQNSK